MAFGGMFVQRKSTFWEVVVEKMDCAGDKMKTIAVLRPHPCGALPICALQCSHSVSHASTTPKFPAMPNRQ